MVSALFFAGLAVLGLVWLFSTHRRLAHLRRQADKSWRGILAHLQRRHELVPDLVCAVADHARHELEVCHHVVRKRDLAASAANLWEQSCAENALSAALKSLLSVAETYPELKTSRAFQRLQQSIQDVENQLRFSRYYYNAVVRELNLHCDRIPTVWVANGFGFKKRELFELADTDHPPRDFARFS